MGTTRTRFVRSRQRHRYEAVRPGPLAGIPSDPGSRTRPAASHEDAAIVVAYIGALGARGTLSQRRRARRLRPRTEERDLGRIAVLFDVAAVCAPAVRARPGDRAALCAQQRLERRDALQPPVGRPSFVPAGTVARPRRRANARPRRNDFRPRQVMERAGSPSVTPATPSGESPDELYSPLCSPHGHVGRGSRGRNGLNTDGARRARTADLLGAIWTLSLPGVRIHSEHARSYRVSPGDPMAGGDLNWTRTGHASGL
jgi:hypothetical protein